MSSLQNGLHKERSISSGSNVKKNIFAKGASSARLHSNSTLSKILPLSCTQQQQPQTQQQQQQYSIFECLQESQKDYLLKTQQGAEESLAFILSNPELTELFSGFLNGQYCGELLDFVRDVGMFRKTVRDLARTIVRKYIAKGAKEEISADEKKKREVQASVEDVCNVFKDLEDEILLRLHAELAPRFLLSEHFLLWKEQEDLKKKEEKKKKELELSGEANNSEKTEEATALELISGLRERTVTVNGLREALQASFFKTGFSSLLQRSAISLPTSPYSVSPPNLGSFSPPLSRNGSPPKSDSQVPVTLPLLTVREDQGQTLLHVVSSVGSLEMVEILLDYHADVNAQDKSLWTPLHVACSEGRLDVCKTLVSRGADVTAETNENVLALHYLAKSEAGEGTTSQQLRDLICIMISKGASVNHITTKLETPLHYVCRSTKDRMVIIRTLVSKGANLEAKTKRGHKPLHVAILSGSTANVKALLDSGAQLDDDILQCASRDSIMTQFLSSYKTTPAVSTSWYRALPND